MFYETFDSFEEYLVFHHKFVTWMEVNGYDPTKQYTQEELDDLIQKSQRFQEVTDLLDEKELRWLELDELN